MGHVGHEHVAGPLLGGRIARVGELQVVQALEVEAQHPARPVDLEGVRVAASDPEPGRFEAADAAVVEPQQREERIVDRAIGNERARQRDALGHGPLRYRAVSSRCVRRSSATPDPACAGSVFHVPSRDRSGPHCWR